MFLHIMVGQNPKKSNGSNHNWGIQKECLIWKSFLGCTILNDHYVYQFIISLIFFSLDIHIFCDQNGHGYLWFGWF